MEPLVDIYAPWRLYSRVGWAALAGSLVGLFCGLYAHWAFVPAGLCAGTSGVLFWLSFRPTIRISAAQWNVGERAIAWREVREINSRYASPLVLQVKLTNDRFKNVVFPGEPEQIGRLMYQLRRNSYLATFDGVAYRDYWLWSSVTEADKEEKIVEPPVRMVSQDDELEIERMFQKLKSVGHIDSRKDDPASDGD